MQIKPLYLPEIHDLPQEDAVKLLLYFMEYGDLFSEDLEGVNEFVWEMQRQESVFRNKLSSTTKTQWERDQIEQTYVKFMLHGFEEEYREYWELYNFSDRNGDLVMLTPLFMEIINRVKEQ